MWHPASSFQQSRTHACVYSLVRHPLRAHTIHLYSTIDYIAIASHVASQSAASTPSTAEDSERGARSGALQLAVPPSAPEGMPLRVGQVIHAGQVVWDFLQQFTLDEARVEAAAAVATPSAPIVIEERQPSNQESQELANARQVVATLQNGGFVIYFKHGNANADYTDITCATDGALTTTGDNQAGLLYNVITDLQVPIGRVFVQDTCAAQQSLDRALPAPPDDIQAYNEADELQAALSQVPPEGTNTLIIGSGDLLPQLDGSSLNAADTLMALPDGQSYAFLTIATIYDWVALEQLINSTDE